MTIEEKLAGYYLGNIASGELIEFEEMNNTLDRIVKNKEPEDLIDLLLKCAYTNSVMPFMISDVCKYLNQSHTQLPTAAIDAGIFASQRGKRSISFFQKIIQRKKPYWQISAIIFLLCKNAVIDITWHYNLIDTYIDERFDEAYTIRPIFSIVYGMFWGRKAFGQTKENIASDMVELFLKSHPSLRNKNFPKPCQHCSS